MPSGIKPGSQQTRELWERLTMSQPDSMVPAHSLETALLISPDEKDHEVLDELFQHNSWILRRASSVKSASALLNEGATSVVITERHFPVGDWKDVLELIHHLP